MEAIKTIVKNDQIRQVYIDLPINHDAAEIQVLVIVEEK